MALPHVQLFQMDFTDLIGPQATPSAWSAVMAYVLVMVFDIGGAMFGLCASLWQSHSTLSQPALCWILLTLFLFNTEPMHVFSQAAMPCHAVYAYGGIWLPVATNPLPCSSLSGGVMNSS